MVENRDFFIPLAFDALSGESPSDYCHRVWCGQTSMLGLPDGKDYIHVALETYGRRAFSYAGPSAWNSLPAHLRSQNVTINNFRHSLKTFLFSQMIHAAH